MPALALLLAVTSTPVLACAAYLFLLVLFSRRLEPLRYAESSMRFDVIVPAHNEEAGIEDTVRSLLAVDYPADRRRVIVVADNCTDATAACAERSGAVVLERRDEVRRGKGHALKLAFERVLSDGLADVAVVVDADTLVSKNLLRSFAARFESGAKAVQAEYGVRNPGASWRTRLMVIALATFHGVRSLGRERLALSSGLRGNGMGFARQVLLDVPYNAFSIVEDVEYGVQLARAGFLVRYVADAHVLGEMVSSEKKSRSQRQRWEGGRLKLAKEHGWPLLKEAVQRRSPVLFDTAMDLLVPPLTYLFGAAVIGTGISVTVALAARHTVFAHDMVFASAPWGLALAMIALYVLRGVMLSGTGLRGWLDLAWAPVYMAWKVAVSVSKTMKRGTDQWVRTAREDEKP